MLNHGLCLHLACATELSFCPAFCISMSCGLSNCPDGNVTTTARPRVAISCFALNVESSNGKGASSGQRSRRCLGTSVVLSRVSSRCAGASNSLSNCMKMLMVSCTSTCTQCAMQNMGQASTAIRLNCCQGHRYLPRRVYAKGVTIEPTRWQQGMVLLRDISIAHCVTCMPTPGLHCRYQA